jgi:hypothetical protein
MGNTEDEGCVRATQKSFDTKKQSRKNNNADAPNNKEYHGPHLKQTAAADFNV